MLTRSYEEMLQSINITRAETTARPKVLELGAGCGLTSVACWLAGYDVDSTDTAAVIPLLEENIKSCFEAMLSSHPSFYSSLGSINVRQINWFEDNAIDESLQGVYDIILCADCSYSSLAVVPLYNRIREVRHMKIILFYDDPDN
jgi:predicted nicotinamide N-methyase